MLTPVMGGGLQQTTIIEWFYHFMFLHPYRFGCNGIAITAYGYSPTPLFQSAYTCHHTYYGFRLGTMIIFGASISYYRC